YIYGVPPTILWTFQDGRPASAGGPAGAARRRAVLMRDFSGGGGTTGCALWRGQIDRLQFQRLVDFVLCHISLSRRSACRPVFPPGLEHCSRRSLSSACSWPSINSRDQ